MNILNSMNSRQLRLQETANNLLNYSDTESMQPLKRIFLGLFILIAPVLVVAQTLLEANGPGNTYELINSVLAPNGGDVVETPDCAHPEFGRHIRESWDDTLQKYVFEFHMHVTPDNDRCINFDRQRLEIKTYDQSPDHMKVVLGETVEYRWKFRLPTGYKVSSSFTHLHQIKPVGGDESTPTFALTARKGNPNKMELSYYPTTASGLQKLASVNLSLFEGQWVEVTERYRAALTGGFYFIEIKNIASGAVIMSYQNNNIATFRADNKFHRPKWGIYRSLNSPQDLRDEVVLFADFSIQELNVSSVHSTEMNNQAFDLIPNPAKSLVLLKLFAGTEGYKNIVISGLCGKNMHSRKVFLHQGLNQIHLDLHHLATGTYLVSVDSEIPAKSLILTN
jgi:hypothetical protein